MATKAQPKTKRKSKYRYRTVWEEDGSIKVYDGDKVIVDTAKDKVARAKKLAKIYEIDLTQDKEDVLETILYMISISENEGRTDDLYTIYKYVKNKK